MYPIRVYKIVNEIDDKLYVGSTKQKLKERYSYHKSSCNNGSTCKVHQHMRGVGIENCRIELIEQRMVNNEKERFQIEQSWIDNLKTSLNTIKAHMTEEEKKQYQQNNCKKYYEKNKEQMLQHYHLYYNENKKQIQKQQQNWKDVHKEEIKIYQQQYQQQWKNKLKEEVKKYSKKHKYDFKCDNCNFVGNKSHYNRHCNSKKHKQLLNI